MCVSISKCFLSHSIRYRWEKRSISYSAAVSIAPSSLWLYIFACIFILQQPGYPGRYVSKFNPRHETTIAHSSAIDWGFCFAWLTFAVFRPSSGVIKKVILWSPVWQKFCLNCRVCWFSKRSSALFDCFIELWTEACLCLSNLKFGTAC